MTLTDFLLARIAEDQAAALKSRTRPWDEIAFHDQAADDIPLISRYGPARVLAECEAKRRIVGDLVLPYIAERRRLMNGQPSWVDEHPDLLRLLALPYADHPDYREEWRS